MGSGTASATGPAPAVGAGRDRGRNRLKPGLLVLEDRRLLSTFTVTSPLDTVTNNTPMTGTLRWAVGQADLATSPSTINFGLGGGPQTITLSQLLDPIELSNTAEPITITGPGANLLTIDGHDEGAVLRIDQGVTATISGLSITNASLDLNHNGGAISNLGSLTISDCTLTGNTISGIYDYTTGTANISDCTLTGNNSFSGAGVFVKGTATITGCTFSGNVGSNGAGISNAGTTTVTNCTITGNSTGFEGGLYNSGKLSVYGSTIVGNEGGGVFNAKGTAYLSGCTISGNSGFMDGGGFDNQYGASLTLNGCTVQSNSAETGGGLYNAGTATITNSTLSGNTATGLGADGGTGYGGGVASGHLQTKAVLTITGSTLSGNTARQGGGGLLNNGTATLTDTTIADNDNNQSITGFYDGGGVDNSGTATLVACTITGNTTTSLAGGVYNGGVGVHAMTLNNTIIAGNITTNAGGGASDIQVGSTSGTPDNVTGSNDLVGTGGAGGLSAGTSQINVHNPGLSPLGDYGGPTLTVALLPGSPAIHGASKTLEVGPQGHALATDQRGLPLDTPNPDIGAFQTQPAIVVNTTIDGVGSSVGDLSLRQAVNLANVSTGKATITFDRTAFAAAQTITLTVGQLELSNTGGAQTITGPAAGLTISGGGASRVFQVDAGVKATITGLTIAHGNASIGGGLYNEGTTYLSGCTIIGSKAGDGGGLADVGSLTLTDCTLTGNFSAGGGALYEAGTATILACTIDGNSSAVGGGIDAVVKGPLTGTARLEDTIVADNTGIGGNPSDIGGSNADGVTGTYDLIGTGGSGGIAGGTGDVVLTSLSGLGLAALGAYGGPTQTIAPLPGSPALGIGAAITGVTTDQRGEPVGSSVDIGAFQSQGFTLTPVLNGTPQGTAAGSAFANLLGVTVKAVNPVEPVSGGVVTYTVNPNGNGASATLSGATGVIEAGGVADVGATANSIFGSYTVTAMTAGAEAPATFTLSNLIPVTFSITSSSNIPFGTPTVLFSGTISDGNQVPLGETVTVSIDGTLQGSGTIGDGGSFSAMVATSSLTVTSTPYTVTYTYTSDGVYASAGALGSLSVTQVTPMINVNDGGGPYNGAAYTASATVTGVSGTPTASLEGVTPTLTYYAGPTATGTPLAGAPTGAGTYTVVANFAGSTDYAPSTSAPNTFTISKAMPDVSVIDSDGTFDNAPFTASATVTVFSGTASASLLGVTPTISYYASPADLAAGTPMAGAPTDAGTYIVVASFAGSTDYAPNASAPDTFTIGKATPDVSVSDFGGTYDGSPRPATATVSGVGAPAGASLEGVTPTFTYYAGPTATGTPLAGAPTGAGTYTVVANFAGSTDYAPNASAPDTFIIGKATPVLNVDGPKGTFDGSALNATATVAGVVAGVDNTPGSSLDGIGLSLTYYSGTYTNPSQLTGVTALQGAPSGAGQYTVEASFGGSADYSSDSVVANYTISPAKPAVSVNDPGGTFDLSTFPATATVAGVVPGVDSSPAASLEGVTPTFTYYAGPTATGTPLAGAPSKAGSYTVLATFAGSADYAENTGLDNFTIGQAMPTVNVQDADGTYDGNAFPATATVTGVNGTAGSSLEGTSPSLLYYIGTYTSTSQLAGKSPLPGAPSKVGSYTVLASFPATADYMAATGIANFSIGQAAPQLTWSAPASIGYGTPLGPAQLDASAGSVQGTYSYSPPSGAILDAGAGQTLSVTFTPADATDYTTASTSTTITVTRAMPALNLTAPGGGFDGSPFAATVTVTGSGQDNTPAATLQDVAPTLTYYDGTGTSGTSLGSSAPGAPGTYTVVASFPGTADYIATQSAPVTFTIGRGTPSIALTTSGGSAVSGQAVTFVATVSAGATGTVTFLDGSTPIGTAALDGSGRATLTTSALAPGTYGITASYGGDADDLGATSSPASVSVGRASPQVVLVPQPVFKKKKVTSLSLEAEVQAMAPGAGVATGVVTFEVQVKSKKKVTEKLLGTAVLGGGKATLTVKPRSVLKEPITILYAGDADFVSGKASPTTLTQASLKSLARPMVALQARGHAPAEVRTHTGRRGRHS